MVKITVMILIFVESPSKAKAINEYLKGSKEKYFAMATAGHIRNLSHKAGSVNTEKNFELTWENTPQWTKNKTKIITEAKKADKIIIASDPDREGEAIAWHLSEVLKKNKISCPIERIIFYSISKSSILEALKNTIQIRSGLVNAYLARIGLDYLFGYSISPLLWRKVPCCKSAGRVQSASLKIVTERENEIINFKSEKYLTIHAKFKESKKEATLIQFNDKKFTNGHIFDEKIDTDELKQHKFEVNEVKKTVQKINAPAPLITSTLQQYASSQLNFSPSVTMQLAQKLYEGFDINGKHTGLITYMRTDSFNIEKEALTKIRSKLKEKFGEKYLSSSVIQHKKNSKNAQEAHEAIRPTDIYLEPDSIAFPDEKLKKLYKLIWERTIATQCPPAINDKVNIKIKGSNSNNSSIFELKSTKSVFNSFKDIINSESNDEDNDIQALNKDQALNLERIDEKDHETQPPKRFSEATFIQQLEKLGIGRPSTYSKIPSILQERNYIVKNKKIISPTQQGWIVTAFLHEYFESKIAAEFTSLMESKLDDIANNNENYLNLLNEFWSNLDINIKEVKDIPPLNVFQSIEKKFPKFFVAEKSQCPCGKEMLLKITKFGAMRGCINYPECKETYNLNQQEAPAASNLGENITLKQGPYGAYIETNDNDNNGKVKRIPVPKIWSKEIDSLTPEQAKFLTSLPKEIGTYNEKPVSINIGRFGPFVQYEKNYVSISDPMNINLEEAIIKIEKKLKKKTAEKSD